MWRLCHTLWYLYTQKPLPPRKILPKKVNGSFLLAPLRDPDAIVRLEAKAYGADFWWLEDSEREYAQASLATIRFRDSVRRYFGPSFFDYDAWQQAQREICEMHRAELDRKRRAEGNAEIIMAASELAEAWIRARKENFTPSEKTPVTGLLMTPERARILEVLTMLVTDSCRLYASRTTIASRAEVGEATVQRFLHDLEKHGALERIRTGGKFGDKHQTNRYTVKWNVLRDLLGVENKWKSKYPEDTTDRVAIRVPNVYYNYEGFAHCSKSERQKRRLRARERAAMALIEQARTNSRITLPRPSEGLLAAPATPVENPSSSAHFSSEGEQNRRSRPSDTVTALEIKKDLFSNASPLWKTLLPLLKPEILHSLSSLPPEKAKSAMKWTEPALAGAAGKSPVVMGATGHAQMPSDGLEHIEGKWGSATGFCDSMDAL